MNRKKRAAGLFGLMLSMAFVFALGAGSAQAAVIFDGSPGTGAPPATLGPYTMATYTDDPRPEGSSVLATSGFPAPSELVFSHDMDLNTVGSGWGNWSHGYTGDVYATGTGAINELGDVTMTMPLNTGAIYFYAEPDPLATFQITATSDDGTTSGPVAVSGNGGATYYGFYGTGGDTIVSVAVSMDPGNGGLAVGEFGWAAAAVDPGPNERGGEFSCTSSALTRGQTNAGSVGPVAGPTAPNARPCYDDRASETETALSAGGGKITARSLYAETVAEPDDTAATAPAAGDMGFAQASIEKVRFAYPGKTIVIQAPRSMANTKCIADGSGGVELVQRSTSSIAWVSVNGARKQIGKEAQADIPIAGVGTLRINPKPQFYDNGARRQIVQQTVWLDLAGFENDVHVARSKSDYSYSSAGDPCTADALP